MATVTQEAVMPERGDELWDAGTRKFYPDRIRRKLIEQLHLTPRQFVAIMETATRERDRVPRATVYSALAGKPTSFDTIVAILREIEVRAARAT